MLGTEILANAGHKKIKATKDLHDKVIILNTCVAYMVHYICSDEGRGTDTWTNKTSTLGLSSIELCEFFKL